MTTKNVSRWIVDIGVNNKRCDELVLVYEKSLQETISDLQQIILDQNDIIKNLKKSKTKTKQKIRTF